MFQVIPKWRVVVDRPNAAPIEIAISDNHLGNVLRDLAKIDFGRDVRAVTINLETRPEQEGHFSDVPREPL